MEIILIILTSLILTSAAVPLTIAVAKKYNLVDDPKVRSHPAHIHKKIVPRAGGLAIFIGIVITSLIFLPIEKHLIGIIVGITILLIIGLIDDKVKNFNPYLRLSLLFVSAGVVVGSGIGISFITNPFTHLPFLPQELKTQYIRLDSLTIPIYFYGPHYIILFADIFAFLWIVAITQIINWAKGVDGQMPSITLIASIILGLLSLKLAYLGDPNQYNVAKLSFIVTGTSLGFLIFNWAPAKILPGFSGSTILAFVLANLAILSGAKVATALLVLAVPTLDFIYTFFRRVYQGKSPVWGDRGHLHHKLLDLGLTPPQISLFYIGISAILGLLALFINTAEKTYLAVLMLIIFIGLILWLNSFGDLSKQSGQNNG